MIIKVCKINNHIYFRNQKRKGKYSIYSKIDIIKNLKSNDWSDPIELDITTKYLIL